MLEVALDPFGPALDPAQMLGGGLDALLLGANCASVACPPGGITRTRVARAFGDAWVRERRTAVFMGPSVVARREGNVLLNPHHAELKKWDARLFARR